MLALLEGRVGDALQEFGVGRERADMAPVDLIGRVAEVLVGQRAANTRRTIAVARVARNNREWA